MKECSIWLGRNSSDYGVESRYSDDDEDLIITASDGDGTAIVYVSRDEAERLYTFIADYLINKASFPNRNTVCRGDIR